MCQIFLGPNIPNWEKYNKWPQTIPTAVNYTKWPWNIPNGHKIYQHLPFRGTPKFTQIWDFWFENKTSGNPDAQRKSNPIFSLKS
jgi:hypothetical protein